MEENSMRFKMRRAEMERYIWKALRRLVLVALVFTAVVGLFGYPAMAQDQTGAGTNLPPPTTTVIPPEQPVPNRHPALVSRKSDMESQSDRKPFVSHFACVFRFVRKAEFVWLIAR
jgi:hypothetical protein